MTFTLEPLRFLLHPVALLAFAAAGQAWIDGADTRAIGAAVLGVLIAGATEAARRRVTPDPGGKPRGRKIRRAGDHGQGIVEVLLIVLLVLVVLFVLFRVV